MRYNTTHEYTGAFNLIQSVTTIQYTDARLERREPAERLRKRARQHIGRKLQREELGQRTWSKASVFDWKVPVSDLIVPVFDWEAPVLDWEPPVFDRTWLKAREPQC